MNADSLPAAAELEGQYFPDTDPSYLRQTTKPASVCKILPCLRFKQTLSALLAADKVETTTFDRLQTRPVRLQVTRWAVAATSTQARSLFCALFILQVTCTRWGTGRGGSRRRCSRYRDGAPGRSCSRYNGGSCGSCGRYGARFFCRCRAECRLQHLPRLCPECHGGREPHGRLKRVSPSFQWCPTH